MLMLLLMMMTMMAEQILRMSRVRCWFQHSPLGAPAGISLLRSRQMAGNSRAVCLLCLPASSIFGLDSADASGEAL
eukprot:7208967-Pyramimonas_sp.AAC.1